jgi:hypothetical protein
VGTYINVVIPLTGTLIFNSLSSQFNGFASGTFTYDADGMGTKDFMLYLNTDFGNVLAHEQSFGRESLVSEPGSLALALLSMLALWQRRRTRGR